MSDGERPFLKDLLKVVLRGDRTPPPYHAFTDEYDLDVGFAELDRVARLPGFTVSGTPRTPSPSPEALTQFATSIGEALASATSRLETVAPMETRRDTALTLLLDQSGSMRETPLLLSMSAALACRRSLASLGVKVEVAGFTTVSWHGGRPGQRCRRLGTRRYPGRLGELLHIRYREADEPVGDDDQAILDHLVGSPLPKENIDGEAIAWAVKRLRSRPANLKVLIVLSDGAPVEDFTLMRNGATYLLDHLKAVLAEVSAAGDVVICAIGIGYDVSRYYPDGRAAPTAEDLQWALPAAVEEVLAREWALPSPGP